LLTGCAAHLAPLASAPVAETHLFPGDEQTAFRSCVDVLRGAGYTIDETDSDAGVIEASFRTREPLGTIDEGDLPDEGRMPGWQAGVLVVTGAALLVGGVVALVQGSQDHEAPADVAEQRVGLGLAMIDLATSIEIPPPPLYEYRVAIQLLPMEGNTTQVRALLDGTETHEGEEPRTGPVRAPGFLTWFYSALDQSMVPEPEDRMQQLLSTR
jgi:hypothetical protein